MIASHLPTARKYRADIEGLRGIAVFIVVAFHCGLPYFRGGFTGVDVFFVLSGYLITGLLVREIEAKGRLNIADFYARRIRRLLPAAALTLIVTLAVSWIVLLPQEFEQALKAARAMALYVSNIWFAINAPSYFGTNVANNPFLHTWSLGVEEQFYLFWPLLIVVGLQWMRSRKALLGILGTVAIVSLVFCIYLTAVDQNSAFYWLPTRAWEFALGGLAALIPSAKVQGRGSVMLGWVGIAGILGSCVAISPRSSFPGWIALVPVLGTTLCLVSGAAAPGRGIARFVEVPPLQHLGKLSYSWYLWHWPALVLAAAVVPNISIRGKIVASGVALVIAAAAHSVVENPIRFHPRLLHNRSLTFVTGAAMMAVSISAVVVGMRAFVWEQRSADLPAVRRAIADISTLPRPKCMSLNDSMEVRSCTFGDAQSRTVVVLFGDSHAMQWFDGFQAAAESNHWKLVTFLKAGCPAVDVRIPRTSELRPATCEEWRRRAEQDIVALRPAVVIMGSAHTYLTDISVPEWREGARDTAAVFDHAGIPMAMLQDTPIPPFDVPSCIGRARLHGWYPVSSCNLPKKIAVNQDANGAERAAIAGMHVRYVDLTTGLCGSDDCDVMRNGQIIYRDESHIVGSYGLRMSATIAEQVRAALSPVALSETKVASSVPR